MWTPRGRNWNLSIGADGNGLVFGSDGETATETNVLAWFAAESDGTQREGSDGPFNLDYNVTIDPNGLIRMHGEIAEEGLEYALIGFAQEGSGILLLTKAIAVPDDGAGDIAVVIAVEVTE